MSILIQVTDPVLARMLLLEAKRQGFREEDTPSLHIIDLDRFPPPTGAKQGVTVIGLSADPTSLSPAERTGVAGLLTLPFSVREFEAVLRCIRPSLHVDRVIPIDGNRLMLGGRTITLSATERRLFDLLYENRHRLVTESELRAALGESAMHTNTPAVYLYRLRKKLCADGVSRIRTVRGKGCQWIEESR
ncbi:MAG: winged helix-turn-helix domain-containing protein [Clostridia bacterium]|nr:winged helix-turn-helix domain-containing protein [Clostridia bacterium]